MTEHLESIIMVAPHLDYPTRNGADIYVDRLACYLSKHQSEIIVIGAGTVTTYKRGALEDQCTYQNRSRSKINAAFRTLIFNNHYLYEKFITNEFQKKCVELVSKINHPAIIYSFIYSSQMGLKNYESIVLTHNDEEKYYKSLVINSKNVFERALSKITLQSFYDYIESTPRETIFAHITEVDALAYKSLIPDHQHIVVPAGVEITPISNPETWDGIIRLLFCGSLSVKMNYDALNYFAQKFYSKIKEHFNRDIDVSIVGSNPSNKVEVLCEKMNWKLIPNVTNEKLQKIYNQCTFSILPFKYTTGMKIKLLNSLAAGLPVLATKNMIYSKHQIFYPNLYSDDVEDWISHLTRIKESGGITYRDRKRCQKYAMKFSWEKIAYNFYKLFLENFENN